MIRNFLSKQRVAPFFAVASLAVAATIGHSASALAASSDGAVVIGVSQPFMSNSWQPAVLESARWAAEQLNAEGKKVRLEVVDANGNTQTQIQQINDLILKKVDVLLVNPSSSSALNGAIGRAIGAGIPTLVFADGPVTSTKPYELNFDEAAGQDAIVNYLAKRLNGKGNILNIRGTAGTGADSTQMRGFDEALKNYPDLKVVATVYGNWDESTTQSRVAAILPSLPKIDAIVTEGQEGYGASQAFMSAGRDVPLQVFGVIGSELNLWRSLHAKNGYTTIASTTDAGVGSLAVNVAYALAKGVKPPQVMIAPYITITQDQLGLKYAKIGDNESAYENYSYDWTEKNIINKK
jgi:ribose transport system substrate-binding protein